MLNLLREKFFVFTAKLPYFWENLSFFLPFWLGVTLVCSGLIYLLLREKRHPETKTRHPESRLNRGEGSPSFSGSFGPPAGGPQDDEGSILKIIGFNFLLFIVLINTVVFLGEIYFRFVFDSSDTLGNLKTSKRWLDRHVVYNADFFRDRNFSTEKSPETTRIAVLGDSFAFGWGVDVKNRFSNILEDKLNQVVKKKFEVYNVAMQGWESTEEADFLEKRAGLFDFDIIVLSYYLNDIYNDRAIDLKFAKEDFTKLGEGTILRPIFENSFFMEFFTARIINHFNSVTYDIAQREMILYKDPKSWENHQKTLRRIVSWCRKNNQRLIVIIFPYLDLVSQKPYPTEFVHQKLKDFFLVEKTEVIDLYPILENYPPKKLMVNPLDGHPSKFVHQLVAEQLYQVLHP